METIKLQKVVESRVKVRFPDCDPFNHLNNSKYIDYIINAREDQLLEYYHFDIYKMAQETGNTWVVAQNQIAYLFSAELMEELIIETSLISFTGKSLLVEAKMYNKDRSQMKAVMWSKLAHFNLLARKSQEHSIDLMQFFNEIHNPLDGNPTFTERVKSLKENIH